MNVLAKATNNNVVFYEVKNHSTSPVASIPFAALKAFFTLYDHSTGNLGVTLKLESKLADRNLALQLHWSDEYCNAEIVDIDARGDRDYSREDEPIYLSQESLILAVM